MMYRIELPIKYEKKSYIWNVLKKQPIYWSNENKACEIITDQLSKNKTLVVVKAITTFIVLSSPLRIWCKENCEGQYGVSLNNVWYFKNRNDMIAFKLKWM